MSALNVITNKKSAVDSRIFTIARFHIGSVKVLLILLAFYIYPAAASNEAVNFNPELLFTAADVEEFFELELPKDHAFESTSDVLSSDVGNYHMTYLFALPVRLYVNNTLSVMANVGEAEDYFREYQAGVLDGLSGSGRTESDSASSEEYGDAAFYRIYSANSELVGSFVIIRSRNKVFDLLIVGAYFRSLEEFSAVFTDRLEELFEFQPRFD